MLDYRQSTLSGSRSLFLMAPVGLPAVLTMELGNVPFELRLSFAQLELEILQKAGLSFEFGSFRRHFDLWTGLHDRVPFQLTIFKVLAIKIFQIL